MGVASTSTTGKGKKGGQANATTGRTNLEKPIELLIERGFRELFYIPNDISIHLVDGDPMSIEKEAPSAIFFTNEQFNTRLHLPLPSLFK